jgi:RNA polymerase III subunit Rpc25
VWKSEEADLWFDPGTVVNIRIEHETWMDRAPNAQLLNADSHLESQALVPYSLTVRTVLVFWFASADSLQASIAEGGLGGIEWW